MNFILINELKWNCRYCNCNIDEGNQAVLMSHKIFKDRKELYHGKCFLKEKYRWENIGLKIKNKYKVEKYKRLYEYEKG